MLAACGNKENTGAKDNGGSSVSESTKKDDTAKDKEVAPEPTAVTDPADNPVDPTAEPTEPDVTPDRSFNEIASLAGIWVDDGSYFIIRENGEMTYYTRQSEGDDVEVRTDRIVLAAGDDPHGFYAQTGNPDDLQTFFSYSPMEENGNEDCLLFDGGESVFSMASRYTEPMTKDQALSAVMAFCFEYYRMLNLEQKIADGYGVDFGPFSDERKDICIWFRSYTGSYEYFYIDPISGYTYVTEFMPLMDEGEKMTDITLNAWDYVDRGVSYDDYFPNSDYSSGDDSDAEYSPDDSDDHATIDAICGRWMDLMGENRISLGIGQNGEFYVYSSYLEIDCNGHIEIEETGDESAPYVYNLVLDDGSLWGDLLWDPEEHAPQTYAYSPMLDMYFVRDPEFED